MEKTIRGTKLVLKKGDITQEEVDAIVNAANPELMEGGGVAGAIHRAAGSSLSQECKEIRQAKGRCPTGEAVVTRAGQLPASYVVHTVGPIWHGGKEKEAELLQQSYTNSLKLAAQKGAKTIAFPSISTGAYGYPVEEAAPLALQAASAFARKESSIEQIRFVLFSDRDYAVWEKALAQPGL